MSDRPETISHFKMATEIAGFQNSGCTCDVTARDINARTESHAHQACHDEKDKYRIV